MRFWNKELNDERTDSTCSAEPKKRAGKQSETYFHLMKEVVLVNRKNMMEKIAFVMQLKPGFEAEYKKRHDELWPDIAAELKKAGVSDYSIFLHPQTLQLFAVLKRTDDHTMDGLPATAAVKRWWAFMADIMETNPDNSPVETALTPVFHFE